MTGESNRQAKSLLIIMALIIFFMPGCRPGNYFSAVEQIPDSRWSVRNRISFDAGIADTLTPFDILFTIRSRSHYPYRNIFMFVTTVSPEGNRITDTLEYQLADERGNWYGRGLSDIHDLSVPFKTDVIFPVSGSYSFRIQHGMRTEDLDGIMDIGIRIRYRK